MVKHKVKHRRKSKSASRKKQQAKFTKAAKACKGRTLKKFRSCMKSKLKK